MHQDWKENLTLFWRPAHYSLYLWRNENIRIIHVSRIDHSLHGSEHQMMRHCPNTGTHAYFVWKESFNSEGRRDNKDKCVCSAVVKVRFDPGEVRVSVRLEKICNTRLVYCKHKLQLHTLPERNYFTSLLQFVAFSWILLEHNADTQVLFLSSGVTETSVSCWLSSSHPSASRWYLRWLLVCVVDGLMITWRLHDKLQGCSDEKCILQPLVYHYRLKAAIISILNLLIVEFKRCWLVDFVTVV